jgi:hypothetical protein
LIAIGYSLGASFGGIEKALGLDLGGVGIGLNRRGRSLTLAGSSGGSQFFNEQIGKAYSKKGVLDEAAVQDAMDRFLAATVRRNVILKQVDDGLLKGALGSLQKISDLANRIKTVNAIRTFEGERTALSDTLDGLLANYATFQAKIRAFTSGRARQIELTKLDQGLARQFGTQVASFGQSFAEATGAGQNQALANVMSIDQQFRDFASQNKALAQTAARSKGKLIYSALSDAQIEAGRVQALDYAFKQLLGTSDDLTSQIQTLAKNFGDIRDAARIAGYDLSKVAEAESKALQRFKDNLLKPIADYLANLRTTDETLSPEARLNATKTAYGQTLLKAQSGDATAISDLPGKAESYRQSALAFYGSGVQYQEIVGGLQNSLTVAMQNVSSSIDTTYQQQIDAITNQTRMQADAYQRMIDQMAAMNDKLAAIQRSNRLLAAK